jgi:hypothetical protein
MHQFLPEVLPSAEELSNLQNFSIEDEFRLGVFELLQASISVPRADSGRVLFLPQKTKSINS